METWVVERGRHGVRKILLGDLDDALVDFALHNLQNHINAGRHRQQNSKRSKV